MYLSLYIYIWKIWHCCCIKSLNFGLIDYETNESRCFMQMIANILGQGSQLREYAMDVEEKLRQVELESIQASWIFLPLTSSYMFLIICSSCYRMGKGLEWSSTSSLQHLLKLSIGALVFWSIYWLCKLLLFIELTSVKTVRNQNVIVEWRSSDFCKQLSNYTLHLKIFWFYYTYRTTWRRVITWCHCMLKFENVIPSSRIWRPYLVDFRLFSSALSPYYCKDCHWHGRCEFSFICLDCIFSLGTSVSYCSGSILI